ncbi:Rv2231c family pyridoxal phosphate-dependent protein CobC [Williamsia sterculiae]|uniref:Aminotransferase n=1 Tax=Williamsia sterculiae TaxID=1344003 RepID=A0A1N7G9E5_9NOCA|nr:Rv2231c family pyridoxal phosphate-dependent protein CobC [Williamsia sterculiae]SIS09137.1 histidinol-phosphate aminotransferase [Williamsia sterculiae]
MKPGSAGVAMRPDLDLAHHGDVDAVPGLLDFAVNVRGGTPDWLLDDLRDRLVDLGRYPAADDARAASDALAERHRRPSDEVLPLAGAAEGFALLPTLAPRSCALIQPSFTEPERVLRAAGVPVVQVPTGDGWRLDPAAVPDDADMVIVGNPTNPTSVLHPRRDIEALRRPGRIVVVDEAFADMVLGEAESVAAVRHPDVLVIRSITKTFALPGLRAGYLLGPADLLSKLAAVRPHWPLGTLQLAALHSCAQPRGVAYAHDQARTMAAERDHLVTALRDVGIVVCVEPAGPFVLVRVPDGVRYKRGLADRGIAVRGCASFRGLDADHLRLAVREAGAVATLVRALRDIGTSDEGRAAG